MSNFMFKVTIYGHVHKRGEDDVVHITNLFPNGRNWRAVVHIGKTMHWQWCKTKREAIAWINSWKDA